MTFEEELRALLKKYNKAITATVVPQIVDVPPEKKDEVK